MRCYLVLNQPSPLEYWEIWVKKNQTMFGMEKVFRASVVRALFLLVRAANSAMSKPNFTAVRLGAVADEIRRGGDTILTKLPTQEIKRHKNEWI